MNRNDWRLRFRALFFRPRMDAELEEEIASHIELQTRKYVQAGMSPEEAKRHACLDFGGTEKAKEECRDSRRITFLSHVMQDLHYSMRIIRRAPGFTALIIAILAIGMGANLATFSVTDAILLRMLPVRDPASLFRMVRATGNATDAGNVGCSYPLYLEMQKRDRGLADLMAYQPADTALVSIGRTEPERLTHQTVSGNYFQVLGIRALAGRLISPRDDSEPGQHAVAVISYRLWNNRFAKSERAIGGKLQSDGHVFDIIGVAAPNFFGVEVGKMVDVWTPVAMAPASNLSSDHLFWLRLMGRLNPGVSIDRAAAPIQAAMNETMLEDVRQHAPPGTPRRIIDQFLAGMRIKGAPAGGGISALRRQYQQPLKIVLFIVGLVLLIACSNVANLLIAKGNSRRQELAIRASLGAGRTRILQQLITESVLLALLAVIGALLLAHWATPALVRLLAPSTEPAKLATGMDLRLLAFTAVLTLLPILICGLLPAIRLAGTDMHTTLKGGMRMTGIGAGGIRRVLVGSQVALSLMLIVGAGLFTRSLVNLMSSYLGFRPNHVLVTTITHRRATDAAKLRTGWSELLRHVRELPGVDQASLSSAGLFAGAPPLLGVRTTAAKPLPTPPITGVLFVSTHYFETLGIGVLHGRDFVARDNDPSSPACIIVNEAFARKFFGGENPLGRQLTKLANTPIWTEIVGIAQDAKYSSLRGDPPPMIYVPYGRIADWLDPHAHPGESMVLQVRGQQSEASLAADLRRDAGEQFITGGVFRQQQLIDDSVVRERLLASIGNVFGGLALFLAATGLYGVISYEVVQRRKELGIRIALGATPKAVLALMLRDSAAIVIIGSGIGVLGAIFTTRLAKALLFGLAPNDPITFIAASLVLLAVSLLAAFIPARRAAGIDPMVALRDE
jgi:predicted permease